MPYRVDVDFTPAHELVLSLDAFLNGQVKLIELGAGWVNEVRTRLGPQGLDTVRLSSSVEAPLLALLISQAPDRLDAEAFLAWYAGLTPGRLYELLAPYVPAEDTELLRDLDELRDRHLRALTVWNETYFRHVDPRIMEGLSRDAAERTRRIRAMTPVEAVDEATSGLVVESKVLERVHLIPQHHFRPLNRYAKCGPVLVCSYSVEPPAGGPGEPGPDLLRVAKALSDESRLRILHFLAGGPPRSFTEVQKQIGLAKNTVHHHLATLRSSGLVRIHLTGECGSERYTARRATLGELGSRLQRFLDER